MKSDLENNSRNIHQLTGEPDELRQQLEAAHSGRCLLSGPGRGDCEHFVGLPGKRIPGQHDGLDDTVDAYGKPNGWCWSCWKSYRLEAAQKAFAEMRLLADYIVSDWDRSKSWEVSKLLTMARQAAATDCGKGWVSPEKVKALMLCGDNLKLLASQVDQLSPFISEWDSAKKDL